MRISLGNCKIETLSALFFLRANRGNEKIVSKSAATLMFGEEEEEEAAKRTKSPRGAKGGRKHTGADDIDF